MKCVCRRKCYITPPAGGRPIRYNPGDVETFKKCPLHFVPLEDAAIDFLTASEAELTEATWLFEDAKKVILDKFNVALKKESKAKVVAQILDVREREANQPPKPNVPPAQ